MGESLNCDHLNESYGAILSCDAVYYSLQCVFDFFLLAAEILKCANRI